MRVRGGSCGELFRKAHFRVKYPNGHEVLHVVGGGSNAGPDKNQALSHPNALLARALESIHLG